MPQFSRPVPTAEPSAGTKTIIMIVFIVVIAAAVALAVWLSRNQPNFLFRKEPKPSVPAAAPDVLALAQAAEIIAGRQPASFDERDPVGSLADELIIWGAAANIDWKFEAEDILWNLEQIVQARQLPIDLAEENFSDNEYWPSDQTDRSLTMIAEGLQKQGYALGDIDIGGDCYTLFLVPNERRQELEALSGKCGDVISFEFGW